MKKAKLSVRFFKIKKDSILTHIISNVIILAVLVTFYLGCIDSPDALVTAMAPIYHGNTAEKKVSLMINVYQGGEYIPDILKTLDSYGVSCTFFVGGSWVDDNFSLVKEMSENNEIGNHGYLHKDHKKLSVKQNRDEISLCEKLVQQGTGKKMNLFAPPSGSFGNNTLSVCEELGYKVIMWSKDTIDWRDNDYMLVYKRATASIQGGDLILMHPTSHTLKALPMILEFYKNEGYEAVTVGELLNSSNVQ